MLKNAPVTMLRAVVGGATGPTLDGFEVGYRTGDRAEHRIALADALAVRFEQALPARPFPSYKGQRHFPGLWWCATAGGHVGFESWLERDHLMLLDHDPAVIGVASQPFWLFWADASGKTRSHAPDYFARRADCSALVVDCRPANRIKPRDAVKFDATREACDLLGWEYRLVGTPDPVLVRNVRWLAGYRHPRHRLAELADTLLAVFARPVALMDGAERAGNPVAVLPVAVPPAVVRGAGR